jgi:hypothetical protein
MAVFGILLLALNAGSACWNIVTGTYSMLPVNAIGIWFSIDIIEKSGGLTI